MNELHVDDSAQVIHVEQDLFLRGLNLYLDRKDKTWGLVDCVSFVLMQDLHITDAFTGDHHFEQAGFRCLLPVRR